MCMAYEMEYEGYCWDTLFEPPEHDLVELLNEKYGAEIVDRITFKNELLELFDSFHERKIIKPKKEE